MPSLAKKRVSSSHSDDAGFVARMTRVVTNDGTYVAKRLMKSTGKAAWIAATTVLVLAVPLIIEMDREQQLTELELQQQSLLGASPGPIHHN